MFRFALPFGLLLLGCATRQPAPTAPAAAATAASSTETAVILEPEPAEPPAPPPPLELELTSAPMGEVPADWVSHPWREAIVAPKDEARIELPALAATAIALNLPKQSPGVTVWVQLDDFAPVAARAGLTLSAAMLEWDELHPGTHRLVLFAADADGRVLSHGDSPLLDVASFVVTASDGGGSVLATGPAQALLSPHGTLNGQAAASSARLQFWTEGTSEAVAVRITGPGGRSARHQLPRGAYALSALPSGDYRFDIGTTPPMSAVVTVNQELSPGAAP